jgi:hypothetical protein
LDDGGKKKLVLTVLALPCEARDGACALFDFFEVFVPKATFVLPGLRVSSLRASYRFR